jgi:outer membrane protein OmpA-like peptidoglycan-associated protein
MGQTPTFGDHFAGRAAPGANGRAVPGGRPDHFRDKAERASLKKAAPRIDKPAAEAPPAAKPPVEKPAPQKMNVAPVREETPRTDAFAGTRPQVKRDPFAQQPSAKRQGLFAKREPAVVAAESKPKTAAMIAAATAAPTAEAKAPLQVVASRQPVTSLEGEPIEVKYEELKREDARRTRTARSSSLVLVTGSAAEAAEVEAPPKPAPAPEPKPEPEVSEKLPAVMVASAVAGAPASKPRGGNDGGGGGAIAASRDRRFTQDDLVGILLGAAVVVLLLLWMLRPKEGASDNNGLFGAQFATNEPVATTQAAPAPAPLVDPFGDAPVDLKPTGPIVEALPEPNVSVAQVDPAPAAPVVAAPPVTPPAVVTATPVPAAPAPAKASAAPPVAIADRTMNAWFCTKSSGMTKASQARLEKEMETFKAAFAGKELIVRGYADTRGSTAFNAALGGERANVVADFLRTNGLNVVDARGIGELDGLDDNQNCSNQRRVDVFVKGGPGETPSRMCAPEPSVKELVCG